MAEPLRVVATWDAEAGVWVAESDDIPGLVTEAPNIDALIDKLGDIVPVLIEENDGADLPEVPISVMLETFRTFRLGKR